MSRTKKHKHRKVHPTFANIRREKHAESDILSVKEDPAVRLVDARWYRHDPSLRGLGAMAFRDTICFEDWSNRKRRKGVSASTIHAQWARQTGSEWEPPDTFEQRLAQVLNEITEARNLITHEAVQEAYRRAGEDDRKWYQEQEAARFDRVMDMDFSEAEVRACAAYVKGDE